MDNNTSFADALAAATEELSAESAQTQVSTTDAAPAEASGQPSESGTPAAVQAQPQQGEQPLEAPQHWEADKREAFKTLPRNMQEYLLDRVKQTDADHTRKTQEVAEQRKTVEPLLGVVKQHDAYFKQLGVSPDQAFTALLNAERTLRFGTTEQKAAGLAQLARDYGIAMPGGEAIPQTNNTPNLDPILSKIQELESGYQSIQHAQMADQVTAFASTKGSDGQPLYPHFEAVKAEMGKLVAATGKTNLAELYEQACYLVPEVREKLFAERLAKERREQTESARKAAAEARKAGVVNLKAETTVSGPQEPTDLSGIIKDAIAANG